MNVGELMNLGMCSKRTYKKAVLFISLLFFSALLDTVSGHQHVQQDLQLPRGHGLIFRRRLVSME